MNGVALDVEAEDVRGTLERFLRIGRELHATSLTAATRLDLSLNDNGTAEFFGGLLGVLGGTHHDATGRRHTVACEQFFGLELV